MTRSNTNNRLETSGASPYASCGGAGSGQDLAPHLVHRAEFLREDEAGQQRLQSLMQRPGYEILDTLELQVADLVKTRNPARKLEGEALRPEIASFLRQRGPGYGVWVHYPWAQRLLRILPEEDFIELRTDRNHHKITPEEQAKLAGKKIGVVGLSVGQSVALTLALERTCGEIRLADFDVIDLSNLNRLRCGIHNIGRSKAVVAAREIAELDPYLNVVCFTEGYTPSNADAFLEGLDLLVDECDSLDMKVRLRENARERRIPVLMNTADRGLTDIERFDVEPQRPLFHGRIMGIKADDLAGLSTEEKVPFVMDIIGIDTSSLRWRASLMEIEQSIKTWPQLAADVTLGGAIVCDVARRLMLQQPVSSGRYFMDLADIGNAAHCVKPAPQRCESPVAPASGHAMGLDLLDRIVKDAMSAPSAGNNQPWQWERGRSSLSLFHAPPAHANTLDPMGLADMVALGASLENAIVSASAQGLDTQLELNPPENSIARLTFSPSSSAADEPLHGCVDRRRSVRYRPKVVRPLAEHVLRALAQQAGRFPETNLTLIHDRGRIEALADLVGKAERLRMLDPEAHADLVREVAWSEAGHRSTGEGLPLSSLSLSATEEVGLRMFKDAGVANELARWNLGTGLSKLARELVSTSSAMGLLWTNSHARDAYLAGGRALQRIWLEATKHDVGLCPLATVCYMLSAWRDGRRMTCAQSCEMPAMEAQLAALFGVPLPRGDIVLFRLLPAAAELEGPRSTGRRPTVPFAGPVPSLQSADDDEDNYWRYP